MSTQQQQHQSAVEMEAMRGVFTHLPECRIIICKQCQFAVVPSQVESHLQTHHPSKTQQTRATIQQVVKGMRDVAHEKSQVKYLQGPACQPVPGLPIFRDGYKCIGQQDGKECTYMCREVSGI